MQQHADGLGKGAAKPPGCKVIYVSWFHAGYLGMERDSRVLAFCIACDCAMLKARLKSDR